MKEKSCLSSRQMKSCDGDEKDEVAQQIIAPSYAFVDLVSFVKEKESLDMNTQEKIEAAGKKEEENVLFLRDMRRYAVQTFVYDCYWVGLKELNIRMSVVLSFF